jgi:pyruvate/2-oxoglutarate dehydrogenase complex dihydrolipoamide acyltransferase (E2) component
MLIEILSPNLGGADGTAVLSSWFVGVGDSVRRGQVIANIETNMALIDFESEFDGVISEIKVSEGIEISDLQLIATIEVS